MFDGLELAEYTEESNHSWIAVYYRIVRYLLCGTVTFYVSLHICLLTGPPPIPAEPAASPEPAYVSKVHYGRKVLYGVFLFSRVTQLKMIT